MRWSSGDYQIAPIAAQSTAMGRWRLTPPWYWGDTACGRGMGRFVPPARVPFFFCKKKGTKENHLDLRSKGPLARYGSCKIGGADLAELVRWVTLLSVQGSLVPLAPLPLMLCEGRIGCAGGVGDYQIAPIAARSTAMGRWRLTPPWYWGTLPAGASWGVSCPGTSNFLFL